MRDIRALGARLPEASLSNASRAACQRLFFRGLPAPGEGAQRDGCKL